MKSLWVVFRELTGLFVDDGLLALQIVSVILLAGISSIMLPGLPLVTGGILIFGCLGMLLANVVTRGSRQLMI
jgi:hypothetical protein